MPARVRFLSFFVILASLAAARGAEAPPLKVLFLGDNGHHRPADRFAQLAPVFAKRGLEMTYTDKLADLNADKLAGYDCLMIYANHIKISPEQEQALVNYVARGGGLVPVHCASACFVNSPKYIELVGAQFRRHGTGVFRTEVAQPDHPLMQGFAGFESWDETYVHHKHNEANRTVLEVRADREGKEPWTWVRTQAQGRVFYTAWGHDQRTWSNPGFHNLLERGVRWAAGKDPGKAGKYADLSAPPAMTALRQDVAPFQYAEAKVPFYPAGKKWGTLADPQNRMQLPLAPAESRKHYVTPVDFELQLFAAEPQIGKPICLNWDERGRLWIAETVDYPNEKQPAGQGRDRIRICEDTDGDGRADKFTVFAEQLSIPTSLCFARGGVIVHQAPDTLFLKDTDGDDVCDHREVLFSGWSTGDTHAGPSNLQYGLDNWIYGMVGYAGFRGKIGGREHTFRTGFYRFRPDGSDGEFLRNTNNNSWGVSFSEEGMLFGSTANGNPSVYMPIPYRYYERVRGWSGAAVLGGIANSARFHPITEKVRQVDHHGNFTAAAGHALYTARTYPRQYWNRTAFVNGPTGHLTATFVLQQAGSDYRSRNSWNLAASDDEWSAPIAAEVGPDGHVWVIDWYNYIVQHNPTPRGFKTGKGNAYETDLRDKKHGRIYRVVYKPAAEPLAFSLANATPEKLVATLAHPNFFWRRHAQRLLVERGKLDLVPALVALVGDRQLDEIGLQPGAIHALWALHGLGALNEPSPALEAAVAALRHPSSGVRLNAAKVLPPMAASTEAILKAKLLSDGDARVRLAAALALADMPASLTAAQAVAAAWADPANLADRWMPDALTSAAAAHDVHFLKLAAGAKQPLAGRGKEILATVAEHYARGAPVDSIAALLPALAAGEATVAEPIIEGLAKGWPKNQAPKLPAQAEEALARLLKKLPTAGRGRLLRLASLWGSKQFEQHANEITGSLLAVVEAEAKPDAERLAAARELIAFRPDDGAVVGKLLSAVTPRSSPALSAGIYDTVAQSSAAEVAPAVLAHWPALTPSTRPRAVSALLRREPWTRELLAAIEAGRLSLADLSLDQKQSLAAHPNRELARRARKLLETRGGLPSPDRQKVLTALAHVAETTGDAAHGKEVFKKQCAKCHRHSGEGNLVGPDLTGMAVHPKSELLVHLLDPSRSVEGNFRLYTLVLADGRVLNGLLASETRTVLEVVDAEGNRHQVQRDDVEELVASKKSVMPEGFEKQVPEQDIVDLLEFLTQRGKFLPLPLGKAATIVSTKGMFHSEDAAPERLIFADWEPKTFADVPFHLVDPRGGRVPNVILLHGPQGTFPPKMPKSVRVPCNAAARAIHLLSGVSGWGHPLGTKGSVSMIVRLHYQDGETEDHSLLNGEHFADYIRRVDVPGSKFAFALRGQQMRYLAITPKRQSPIREIEFVKGNDATAPLVMAVTVETGKE